MFFPPDEPFERGKPSQITCKETEDAARFKYLATGAAAGVKKATSAQLEYISHGTPGIDMIEHQLPCAESAPRAFPTLKSLAGDGRPQIDRDFAPRANQSQQLERDGLHGVAVLSQLPPTLIWWDGDATCMRRLPLAQVERKAKFHVALERVVLGVEASFQLVCLLGGDAAFLMQYCGVSLQSKCNQLFNLETREDRNLVWYVDVLKAGETPRQYARRTKSSSFDKDGHSWFLDLILLGMREDMNLVAFECTKLPDQEDEVTIAGDTSTKRRPMPRGKGASRAAAKAADLRGAGQNTGQAKKCWASAVLREVGYVHNDFSPLRDAFDGAAEGAEDFSCDHPVAMRVPIVHDALERHLGDAAGDLPARKISLALRLVLCAMHAVMRLVENCLNLLSAPLREVFENDTSDGPHQRAIQTHWNGAMQNVGRERGKRGIRHKMYNTKDAKDPPKAGVNGKESRIVYQDFGLMCGCDVRACIRACRKLPSAILEGYYQSMVACGLDVENLDQIAEVLVHFSRVADIMLKMKPTAADRTRFHAECRLYRAKKICVWGAGCWYDRTMHVMPTLLDTYFTMGALTQQSMEGNQNFTQTDLRSSAHNAGGRPKKEDIEKGAAHWAEVLAERKRRADAPDKWMWDKAIWRFITEPTHAWLLELVGKLRTAGHVVSNADLCDMWRLYTAAAKYAIRWAARARIEWEKRRIRQQPTTPNYFELLQDEVEDYYQGQSDFSHQREKDEAKSLLLERKAKFSSKRYCVCSLTPTKQLARMSVEDWLELPEATREPLDALHTKLQDTTLADILHPPSTLSPPACLIGPSDALALTAAPLPHSSPVAAPHGVPPRMTAVRLQPLAATLTLEQPQPGGSFAEQTCGQLPLPPVHAATSTPLEVQREVCGCLSPALTAGMIALEAALGLPRNGAPFAEYFTRMDLVALYAKVRPPPFARGAHHF